MASDNSSGGSTGKNPKKANLLDQHSIKQLLDESVTEIVSSKGYPEDVRLSNLRLLIGTVIIAIALLAQFYPMKFPQNKDFLIVCIGLYVLVNVLLQFISYTKEKNAILFTYPPPVLVRELKSLGHPALVLGFQNGTSPEFKLMQGSFHSTGLVVSSKMPRFSDMYTLTVESADPKSIAANKPVHLTKSVTKWFTKDGIIVEGLFWKDVEKLVDDYAADRKSK